MDNKFELEDRYLVVKRKEIAEALSRDEIDILFHLVGKVASHRWKQGKEPLKCVVVEADWPTYPDTVLGIQRIAEGNTTTVREYIQEAARNAGENGYSQTVEDRDLLVEDLERDGYISYSYTTQSFQRTAQQGVPYGSLIRK